MNGKGEVLNSGVFIPDFSDCIVIPAYDTVKEKKYQQKKHPSRAQKKRQTLELIKDYEDEEFEK